MIEFEFINPNYIQSLQICTLFKTDYEFLLSVYISFVTRATLDYQNGFNALNLLLIDEIQIIARYYQEGTIGTMMGGNETIQGSRVAFRLAWNMWPQIPLGINEFCVKPF